MHAKKLLLPLSCLSMSLIAPLASANCINWPKSVFQPTPNTKTGKIAPDYGIYWFKNINGNEKAMRAYLPPALAPQFSNGKINRLKKGESLQQARDTYTKKLEAKGFFDPKKPTLLFIHGDQPTLTAKRKRVDFCYNYTKNNNKLFGLLHTGTHWKNWNIGIFYWNQFADDVQGKSLSDFVRAITWPEMKIYSSKNAAGMRWTYLDKKGRPHFCYKGNKHCINLPTNKHGNIMSVRELAYGAYINAFPKGYNEPIRIAGQSLGTQVAIQLAGFIAANHHVPQPNELILLDPYFTPGLHHLDVGLGKDSAADYSYHVAKQLLKNNPKLGFAIYRTTKLSEWPTGDRNKPLENLSAYLRICPAYLKNAKQKQLSVDEHISCAYIYMHSKQFPAPKNFVNANSSAADIRKLMGTKRYCTITNFQQGCQSVSMKPIHCPLESKFFKIH